MHRARRVTKVGSAGDPSLRQSSQALFALGLLLWAFIFSLLSSHKPGSFPEALASLFRFLFSGKTAQPIHPSSISAGSWPKQDKSLGQESVGQFGAKRLWGKDHWGWLLSDGERSSHQPHFPVQRGCPQQLPGGFPAKLETQRI